MRPLPPVPLTISFIDCINRGDVNGLSRLMTDDHRLQVLDESPLVGRSANTDAWDGYVKSFPMHIVHPHRIAERDGMVAVLGHTTGSHLDLPEAEESRLTLIWLAEIADGAVRSWTLVDDSPENRRRLGLDATD